jgi:hypothetical protein
MKRKNVKNFVVKMVWDVNDPDLVTQVIKWDEKSRFKLTWTILPNKFKKPQKYLKFGLSRPWRGT